MEVLRAIHATLTMFVHVFVKNCPRPSVIPQFIPHESSEDCHYADDLSVWTLHKFSSSKGTPQMANVLVHNYEK